MKRAALLLLATIVLASPAYAAGGWHKSIDEAKKQARQSGQMILVDLFADWCGWCHRMEKEVFPSEAFRNASKDLVLLRVDTEDGGPGQAMSRDYRVQSLPTFLLLTPDLMLAGELRGYMPPTEFAKQLGVARANYAEFKKRLAATPASDEERMAIARELVTRRGFSEAESRLNKLIARPKVKTEIRDEAYYYLAVSQLIQRKHDQSIKTIQSFLKIAKQGAWVEKVRLLEAEVYLDQGKLPEALGSFKRFKNTYPNSPMIANVNNMIPAIEREIKKPIVAK